MKCPVCKQDLIYFPDVELVCGNKDCKNYAPNTYTDKDFEVIK